MHACRDVPWRHPSPRQLPPPMLPPPHMLQAGQRPPHDEALMFGGEEEEDDGFDGFCLLTPEQALGVTVSVAPLPLPWVCVGRVEGMAEVAGREK